MEIFIWQNGKKAVSEGGLKWILDERVGVAQVEAPREYTVHRGNSMCEEPEAENSWCLQVG